MNNLDKVNQSLADLVDVMHNISQDLEGANYENISETLDVIDKITVILKRFNDMGIIIDNSLIDIKNTSEKEVVK